MSRIKRIEKYRPIYTSDKRYKRLHGGGGSGKSIAIAQKILLDVLGFNGVEGVRAYAVRKVARTTRTSVFQTFRDFIDEWGIASEVVVNRTFQRVECPATGGSVECIGMDDPEKVKSIKDPTCMWMEEATEFTLDDFIQLDLRLRKAGIKNEIFLSYNPISKNNWIYKTFEEEAAYAGEELLIRSTYKDNPFNDARYAKVMEGLAKRSIEHYNVYALGLWGELGKGVIFQDYEFVESFPSRGTLLYGLDFGFTDPQALVKVVIDDSDLYVQEVQYEVGQTVPGLIGRMRVAVGVNDFVYYDSANPGKGQQIYNAGFRLAKPAKKGADSIQAGIDVVKNYNLKIVTPSPNLSKELKTYRWAEDKEGKLVEGKPIDANNHAIDALRYAVFTHTYRPTQQVKTSYKHRIRQTRR